MMEEIAVGSDFESLGAAASASSDSSQTTP